MLGKLPMTVDEAIDKYLEQSRHIFSKKKWIWKEGRY
ncbi:patatin-like phospholipase, putative [Rhizoctonia solani AG-3 Rhs1AP]|uniref:Patatin-like phospholipase, putative n=1 Tax=Rhizoctonia solani AG-3 Rhs1AP TaxID=1086054 RepID=X8JAV5_9AGAM|nr:patatin-like phospholipase, putative [Rhizoctonia solani AG-3 Rhs1AP]